ncbi:MAG TPA: hypothetical protein VF570_02810 [Pyrinomonadaceae bacterium]|jgi:hypothetical protein
MAEKSKDSSDVLVLILVTPLLLLAAAVWLAFKAVSYPFVLLYGQWLVFRFWRRHGRFGRFVLFVYSDSPNWKGYVESNILPRVGGHAVTLNWSRRGEWARTHPFEAQVFRHWAGEREFNPLALVIRPGRRVKVFRFWQAFRDFKHGKDRALAEALVALFREVEGHRAARPPGPEPPGRL